MQPSENKRATWFKDVPDILTEEKITELLGKDGNNGKEDGMCDTLLHDDDKQNVELWVKYVGDPAAYTDGLS